MRGTHREEEAEGEVKDGVVEPVRLPEPAPTIPTFLKPQSTILITVEDLNPVPPGSPHTRAPRSPGSGKPPPMWATCTKLKPELQQQNRNLYQSFSNLPRFTKGDSQPLPSNLVPLVSTHGNPIITKLKPDLHQNQNLYQSFPNLSRSTKGDSQPPSNLVPLSSTHDNSINKPSNPRPKIQKSITDFITKGKKRLHSIQLTADVTKKSNTRLVPTNRETTVKMA